MDCIVRVYRSEKAYKEGENELRSWPFYSTDIEKVKYFIQGAVMALAFRYKHPFGTITTQIDGKDKVTRRQWS